MPKEIHISVKDESGHEEFSATILTTRFDAKKAPSYGLRLIAEELQQFLSEDKQ